MPVFYKPNETKLATLRDLQALAGGISLIPPSVDSSVLEASLPDLSKVLPYRYRRLVDACRARQRGEEVSPAFFERIQALNLLDRYLSGETHLHPRQHSIVRAVLSFFEAGGTRTYYKGPPGIGKTEVNKVLARVTGLKTLVVVPYQLLVNDVHGRISSPAAGLSDRRTVGMLYGKEKERDCDITVITYQSLILEFSRGNIKPGQFPLIIFDEAHRAGLEHTDGEEAVKRSVLARVVRELMKESWVIGSTATDVYYSNKKVSDLFGRPVDEVSYQEAVDESLICPFSVRLFRTSADIRQVGTLKGDYHPGQLATALSRATAMDAVIEVQKELYNKQPALVFCADSNHARAMAERLRTYGGLRTEVCLKDTQNRAEILAQLNEGVLDIVTGVDVISTGVNLPNVAVSHHCRPTRSLVVVGQQGGRAGRINPNDPDKHAYLNYYIPSSLPAGQPPLTMIDLLKGKTAVRKYNEYTPTQAKSVRPYVKLKNVDAALELKDILHMHRQIKRESGVWAAMRGRELSIRQQIRFLEKVKPQLQQIIGLLAAGSWYREYLTSNQEYLELGRKERQSLSDHSNAAIRAPYDPSLFRIDLVVGAVSSLRRAEALSALDRHPDFEQLKKVVAMWPDVSGPVSRLGHRYRSLARALACESHSTHLSKGDASWCAKVGLMAGIWKFVGTNVRDLNETVEKSIRESLATTLVTSAESEEPALPNMRTYKPLDLLRLADTSSSRTLDGRDSFGRNVAEAREDAAHAKRVVASSEAYLTEAGVSDLERALIDPEKRTNVGILRTVRSLLFNGSIEGPDQFATLPDIRSHEMLATSVFLNAISPLRIDANIVPLSSIMSAPDRQRVKEALSHLSPEEREIVTSHLLFVEGETVRFDPFPALTRQVKVMASLRSFRECLRLTLKDSNVPTSLY